MKIEITNQSKWHQSITLKLAVLAFMGILLLIPLQLIKETITERQRNGENAIKEISEQWAAKQIVAGPVLNIPVRTIPENKDEKAVSSTWHILPESLATNGTIKPEIRRRGIYRAVVYDSDLEIRGELVVPSEVPNAKYEILWDKAYYTVGISDNRGLKGKVFLKADSSMYEAEPGVRDNDIFPSGITFQADNIRPGKKISISLDLSLSGSEGLQFSPVGKTTNASLRSSWPSPSFSGNFLPAGRNVTESGFDANWQITHLNRNFPQSWTGKSYNPLESSFGADLFQPVDHYQKSWRSARYGILFIALTFLVLIFLEITRRENIHIFHYFLVSLGLILFFSLLNSLSEQTGFNLAYLISSAGTILMITFFMRTLFRDKRNALAVPGILILLYSFIFILLSLDEFAYLAGNVGLFILLFAIMMLAGRMKAFRNDTGE